MQHELTTDDSQVFRRKSSELLKSPGNGRIIPYFNPCGQDTSALLADKTALFQQFDDSINTFVHALLVCV